MFCFTPLQIFFQRVLAPSRGRAALRQRSQGANVSHASLVDAPQASNAAGGRRDSICGNTHAHQPVMEPIQALADLDVSTVWPTHRIRCFLHTQPVPGAGHCR